MRFLPKVAALLLLSCPLLVSAAAEENHGDSAARSGNISQQDYRRPSARLLNTDEGLAIIGAALEFRHHNRSKPDCSHFVNTIYTKAGFPYDYANSIELYTGTDTFHRVARPQPGDLVVWQGHVGIVIQPAQHTFFSALRSGLGVEDYESPYWRKRGRPRFFRYVQAAPPAVLAADTRLLNVKNSSNGATIDDAGSGEVNDAENRLAESGESPDIARKSIPNPGNANAASTPLIYSQKPRPEDVRVVLIRTFNDVEHSLRGQDMLRSDLPITVFESMDVKKVHVKGNTGWADVRVKRLSSVAQGQAKVKTNSETRRFSLTRRDLATWEVIIPTETLYVPREAAVRLFAHQLASMTDLPPASAGDSEKVQLARLLTALLQTSTR